MKTKRVRRPKHTHEQIAAAFKAEGYTLLTPDYLGNKQKLFVTCSKGHNIHVCWNNFSRGNRCPACMLKLQRARSRRRSLANHVYLTTRRSLYNISEAARFLKIEDRFLREEIHLGDVPPPGRFLRKRFYYTAADLREIETMLQRRRKMRIETEKHRRLLEAETVKYRNSLYNITQAARLLKIEPKEFYKKVVDCEVAPPGRLYGKRYYYTRDEVRQVRAELKS
jgi:hypothetical protein